MLVNGSEVLWTFVHRWRGRCLEQDLQCSLYMDYDIRTLKRDGSEATTEVVETCRWPVPELRD